MPYVVVQSIYSDTLFEFAGSKTHIRVQEEQHQFYQKQQQLLPDILFCKKETKNYEKSY